MVISSSGGAAQFNGGSLGQYEYHEDLGYYVQTSTEQSDVRIRAVYLYRDENGEWTVGPTPGATDGWLNNPLPSQTVPTFGWKYTPDGEGWYDDRTLAVIPGLLTLPRQFMVTATGAAAEKWPSYLGVFTRTERWWLGRPVYVNTEGALLHHGAGGDGWMIGDKIGYSALRGSRARHSPITEDRWSYWTGSESKPASVTVTVKTGSD